MPDDPQETQRTQTKGIDSQAGESHEPVQVVPKREDVEDALDRLISAAPDDDRPTPGDRPIPQDEPLKDQGDKLDQ